MAHLHVIWDTDDDPAGNVRHIAEHGLTPDDVEHVLMNPESEGFSKSSQRPGVWGYTPAGEYIFVVYETVDADSIYPITAFEVPEPR